MNTYHLIVSASILVVCLMPDAMSQTPPERFAPTNLYAATAQIAQSTLDQTDLHLDSFFPRFPAGTVTSQSDTALRLAKHLGRGVNLGNMLETPLAAGEWGVRPNPQRDYLQYVDLAKQAGFTHIRLPVRWSNHAAITADATIDAEFAQRVDRIVNHALAEGLSVVMNMHHYRQFDGTPLDLGERKVAENIVDTRMLFLWRQIATRYQNHSEKLFFEVYNEPNGRMEARWNSMLSRALREIRNSNPTRVVVIGPTQWNSVDALAKLELPSDPHLIVTVHNYDPFAFTHQGASWVKPPLATGTRCCTNSQENQILNALEKAYRWGQDQGYSIYLGEFGAYDKAAMDDRVVYTRVVSSAATRLGFSWAYWEMASGFGLFDPALQTWRLPLLDALLRP